MGRKRKKRRRSREDDAPKSGVPLSPEVVQSIEEWSQEAAEVHDFDLWDVEVTQHGRWVVRVYIDHVDAEPGKGINVGQCAEVSRYIEAIFDADERTPEVYVLEVSSPGIERPLKKASHFDRVVGHNVELVLRDPVIGKNKVIGRLLAHKDDVLTVEIEEEEFEIERENVARAKLKFDF